MDKQNVLDNTTFVLSGHNIKWFAVLGIETLIKNCGVSRSHVAYFDDFSTDGTKEELESRGVRVISWDKIVFRNFRHSFLNQDLCVRVDQIVGCICRQVASRYVCILDGDTAYSSNAADYILDKATEDGEMPDFFGIYRKAGIFHEGFPYLEHNIWQNYMWFDLEKLNSAGVTANPLSKIQSYYESVGADVFNDMYDTGVVFYNKLVQTDLKTKLVRYVPGEESADSEWINGLLNITNHLGWLSSSMRDDAMFSRSWEDHKNKLRGKIIEDLGPLCEDVGLSAKEIAEDLIGNVRQSVICE